MALLPLQFAPPPPVLPRDVRLFLKEAERRIERFQRHSRCPAFVPSDYPRVYAALHLIEETGLAAGQSFCEWGSGFGVVAGLASLLGFDACGIEAEGELVTRARLLARDFDLPVTFAHGSFLPAAAARYGKPGEDHAWLETDMPSGYPELGLDADDFDLIFAYPWPDEEGLTARLFESHGRAGALLVTYHGGADLRLHRRVRGRKGG
jgi:hypothetical protein